VIAPSFGDIFAQNAAKNGLLPAQVDEAACEMLLACAGDGLGFTVDLEAERITVGPLAVPFSIDPVRRLQLLKGWDDLDLTALHQSEIAAFRARRLAEQPWAWPAAQARR
jgi:3-isopropylmalate/(R)-2-methylmalate dehydratase small subunit